MRSILIIIVLLVATSSVDVRAAAPEEDRRQLLTVRPQNHEPRTTTQATAAGMRHLGTTSLCETSGMKDRNPEWGKEKLKPCHRATPMNGADRCTIFHHKLDNKKKCKARHGKCSATVHL